ncbi:SA1002 family membrane protein [Lactobacillus corticis]|uniref:Uncharacterized protein n=1 Tax=Lactobacillus corticis TaxID=2201249 RepID=A0A916QG65_9LACO|nr:hypothetical protein [Lactobacillus corticis]GFZ26705.1 hypothetical protein LCB40_05850 [Lactobacillus corticis]
MTWFEIVRIVALGLFLLILFALVKVENKRVFVKALLLLLIMIVVSTLCVVLLYLIDILTFGVTLNLKLGGQFLWLALILILAGIILYYFLRFLDRLHEIQIATLTVIEYYIQWTLIYVTVYQVAFSELGSDAIKKITKINASNLLDPSILVLFILPALISSWIAVVLLKNHKKAL